MSSKVHSIMWASFGPEDGSVSIFISSAALKYSVQPFNLSSSLRGLENRRKDHERCREMTCSLPFLGFLKFVS